MLALILLALIIGGIGGFVLTICVGVIAREEIEWRNGAFLMIITAIVVGFAQHYFTRELGWGIPGWLTALAIGAGCCGLLVKSATKADWRGAMYSGVAAGAIMGLIQIVLTVMLMPVRAS